MATLFNGGFTLYLKYTVSTKLPTDMNRRHPYEGMMFIKGQFCNQTFKELFNFYEGIKNAMS